MEEEAQESSTNFCLPSAMLRQAASAGPTCDVSGPERLWVEFWGKNERLGSEARGEWECRISLLSCGRVVAVLRGGMGRIVGSRGCVDCSSRLVSRRPRRSVVLRNSTRSFDEKEPLMTEPEQNNLSLRNGS